MSNERVDADLRGLLIAAVSQHEGWEESAIALVDEAIMPVLALDAAHFSQAAIAAAREALEWYADESNRGLRRIGDFKHGAVWGDPLLMDNGKLAKQALAIFDNLMAKDVKSKRMLGGG